MSSTVLMLLIFTHLILNLPILQMREMVPKEVKKYVQPHDLKAADLGIASGSLAMKCPSLAILLYAYLSRNLVTVFPGARAPPCATALSPTLHTPA